jgi:tetratricopeptide (TPR) repeat protein
MKLKCILFFLIIVGTYIFADIISDELLKVNKLIEEKKYLDAIHTVNGLQKKYDDPRLVYYQTDISINYFITSINHRMFGFKNLLPNENIEELRGQAGSFTMVVGDLKETLEEAVKKYPNSPIIYEAIGKYFIDIKYRYGDQLNYTYEEIVNEIVTNYKKAYELGNDKEEILAGIAEYSMYLQDYKQGIDFYKLALKNNPNNPTYNYNIAYAYERSGDLKTALKHSELAIKYYTDDDYKADAYMMYASENQNIGNMDIAIQNYKLAIKLKPSLYYANKQLINYYLSSENFKEAKNLTIINLKMYIRNFKTLKDIINIYIQNNIPDDIEEILFSVENLFDNSNIDKATIHYHIGLLYNTVGKKDANKEFEKAKELYSLELEPDHPIFQQIESILKEM